jgi:hypothetical protein
MRKAGNCRESQGEADGVTAERRKAAERKPGEEEVG